MSNFLIAGVLLITIPIGILIGIYICQRIYKKQIF